MKAPIKEPLNVDLEVVSRELTAKEAESLQAFLQANKAKALRKRVAIWVPEQRSRPVRAFLCIVFLATRRQQHTAYG
jgi:hypothetical protein